MSDTAALAAPPARIDDGVAWEPNADYLRRSRLLAFMRDVGVDAYAELLTWAAADPGRYWAAAVEHLGLDWARPYTAALDLRNGAPWAEWFTGGGFNYVANAVDRHGEGERRNQLAFIWEGDDGEVRSLTYRQLLAETNRFANALRALGVAKGDRVGIFLPMITETVVAVLACGKIGAIYTPMFSGYGEEAVASRLRDSGATLLITADGFRRRGSVVRMKPVADAAMAAAPEVARCIVVRRTGEEVAWRPGRDLWWHDAIAEQSSTCLTDATNGDDPYMIIHTSGTTGRPKGAVHVHAGFPIKAAHDLAFCFDLHPEDTLFWLTDLGWMMGPWEIGGGLMLGATLLLFEGTPDHPEPDRLWSLVETHGVSVLGVAPTAIRSLMSRGTEWVRKRNLSSLRVLGSTGETWNPSPWWWYFDEVGGGRCPIVNYSGGTETGGGIVSGFTMLPIKPRSFTGPVPGMAADVVDDAGASVRGVVGELVVRQPWVGMTRGFWQDPDRYLDAYWARFPDTWVHGDWAEVDADGFWFIRGRSDDTLKVAGKRIGPAEVESAAVAHPAVQEAAAIGVPHEITGETVVVFAVPRPGHQATDELAEAVRQTIGRRLGSALRPGRVHLVTDLPKTRNAKIMRRVIRATYLGQPPGDLTALENPGAVDEIAGSRTGKT
ncbi:MAG: AMP-binding protein [Thermomicrobiales bacterium]